MQLAAEAVGTEDMPINVMMVMINYVQISLIAPPMYVMTAMTLDEKVGIELLTKALEVLKETITAKGGNLVIKNDVRMIKNCNSQPRVAHKEEDADLEGLMKKAEMENQEVEGDEDEDDE